MKSKIDLFLDSGAFSAWVKKETINIREYIHFVKENLQYLEVYANLDVIGDPKATLANQELMEEAGLHPLPCYHFGEDPRYLIHYLKSYDYIALGGMVGRSFSVLGPWLDDIFSNYICDKDGMPKVKVHGFGLTSLRLMLRYPWFSVDSTSWVITGRMGCIFVPRFVDGEYVYDVNSWKVAVSSRSPSKEERGKHLHTFSPLNKEAILAYIRGRGYSLGKSSFKTEDAKKYELKENERWFGKEFLGPVVDSKGIPKKDREGAIIEKMQREVEVIEKPGLCNDYKLRDEFNIQFFVDLEKEFKPWPWPFIMEASNSGFDLYGEDE